MEETLRSHLITLASALESASGITPATVGKRALNDNTFFARMAAGSGFTIATYDRLVLWFSDNWPDDTAWPSSVSRSAEASAA